MWGHLVGFDKIKSQGSGLDVVAILDAVSGGGVVVHLKIPRLREHVAVRVAVAVARFAPLDHRQLHSYLEKKEMEHGVAVFPTTPEHGGVIDLAEPSFHFGRGLADKVFHEINKPHLQQRLRQ